MEHNRVQEGIMEALSAAVEFRSEESGEHVKRIRDMTKYLLTYTALGEGISPYEAEQIAEAAMLHDVGKIALPDTILNKPGRLTAEEYEIMKMHTIQGARLLEKIPQFKEMPLFHYAYDIARHHHERWDGRGYPDGLKGGEISLWAQIVSLVDAYDALVSHRVYKEAYDGDAAVRMILDGACGIFNDRLLGCFLSQEKEIRKLYR